MQNPLEGKGPAGKLALFPLILGVIGMAFGILMMLYPAVMIQIFIKLLGFGMLMAGLAMALFGMNLWKSIPGGKTNIQIGKWHVWPGDDQQ